MADLGVVNVQFWDIFEEIVTDPTEPSVDDVYVPLGRGPDYLETVVGNEIDFGGALYHLEQTQYPVGPSAPPNTPRLYTGAVTYLLRGFAQNDETDPISRRIVAIDMETNEVVGETVSSTYDGSFSMQVVTTGRVRVMMHEADTDGKNTVILSNITPIPNPVTINIPGHEG